MTFWNKNKFQSRCNQSIDSFRNGFQSVGEESPGNRLFYRDNGSSVLAVAHLDSVQPHKNAPFSMKNGVVRCPTLDDRMGVHIILDILPAIGVNVDVLLTEGEEVGRSTAQLFNPAKEYNWMVEFDRAGDDVVTYDFSDKEWDGLLADEGFKVGWGSFTDICFLEEIGVKAFNIGVGYQEYHSVKAWADLDTAEAHIWMFAAFYHKFSTTKFPHKKIERHIAYRSYSSYRGGWAYDDDLDDIWDIPPKKNGQRSWVEKNAGRYMLSDGIEIKNPETVSGVAWTQCVYCGEVWPKEKCVDTVDGKVCEDCARHFLKYAIDTGRYEYESDVGMMADGTWATHQFLLSNGFAKPVDKEIYYSITELVKIDGSYYRDI